MEITTALLCDAATVREGLLHVLGGGITRLWRDQLPAPLGVTLALVIDVAPEDLRIPHEIEMVVRCGDDQIARTMGGFQAEPHPRAEPGEHQMAPVIMALSGGLTPRYGHHSITVRLDDGRAERALEFWVLHPDEQLIPPIA